MKDILGFGFILSVSLILGACQAPNFDLLNEKSRSILGIADKHKTLNDQQDTGSVDTSVLSLESLLDDSLPEGDLGQNFKSVMLTALVKDPIIASNRLTLDAKLAAVDVSEAGKEFQVSGSVYGGIEDITDNTKGLALVVNASRLVYDGGLLDARISEKAYQAFSARQDLRAVSDERALRLGNLWVELEKYENLQGLIDSRLDVLNPLIEQLEQVAQAGVGDVSMVASAQRTVSEIRVAQTRISEGLAQSRLNYINAFGKLPGSVIYDANFISDLVPVSITEKMVHNSPAIASKYAAYQAAAARILALEAKDGFNVDFEARATRPFAGSGKDSDESLGLVARKTLYNGGMLESEIKEATAYFEGAAAQIKSTYREGSRTVETARQNIVSMDKAIVLAKENAELTSDEIIYLRQQLIIGGSTLESVLSAESRLYDAESKEINFRAERRKSELAIVSALGLLSPALGVSLD